MGTDEKAVGLNLRDTWHVLRKRWRLVAVCPLLAVFLAAIWSMQATPQYQSTVRFFVSTPGTGGELGSAYTGGLFSQQRVKSYQDLLSGQRVAQAVLADIGREGGLGHVSARAKPDTVLLAATVTHPDATRARDVAAAIGRVFPGFVEILETPKSGGDADIRAIVVEDPRLPGSPVSPRPVRNVLFSFAIGSLLGVGLAVARDALDNTVRNQADLSAFENLALLGAIGFDPRARRRPLIVQDEPASPRAEAFRQLRTNLQFVAVDEPLRSIVITSSIPGEGKSTSACNLAITLAQAGIKVLLLEADLRRPKTTEYLGIESTVGLTSVLIGQVRLEDAIQSWGSDGLAVLPSGPLPPNPSEMLGSEGMRGIMGALEKAYAVVIVDAPPLLPVTDAAILATLTTGAVVCMRAGRVRREQATRALASLSAVGAHVLGGVLTMVPRRGPDSNLGYGYGYGYTYGYTYARAASTRSRDRAQGRDYQDVEKAADRPG